MLVPPHLEKWGVQKFFFARSARESCFVPLTFRVAAPPPDVTVLFYHALLHTEGWDIKRQYSCFAFLTLGFITGLQNDESQHTPQADDGLHPAAIALIVVLILFPVIIAAAVAFWCYL